MKILFIGGVYEKCFSSEIMKYSKEYIEYSANNLQLKLIQGLENQYSDDLSVISAPFLGAFPKAYRKYKFIGFNRLDKSNRFRYVHFNNIWGIRNFSRAKSLIREISGFVESKDISKWIIVYSSHTPFLEAACNAKKNDPKIKICLIVPDLPQYMNFENRHKTIYNTLKKFDLARFDYLSRNVDCFVLLTDQMKIPLKIGNRPYIVIEGIIESECKINRTLRNEKTIVYTGKLNISFGVENLLDAFGMIEDKDIKLILCGKGELEEKIRIAALHDKRINYKGQVSSDEAKMYINNATVLVNPRQNIGEFTKYSFPSKNIDYLLSGNRVIAYKLDGVPSIYKDFMYYVQDNSVISLKKTIEEVLKNRYDCDYSKSDLAIKYLCEYRNPISIGREVANLLSLFEVP